MVYVDFAATNLAELLEVIETAINEASADRGAPVDPHEILIGTSELIVVSLSLQSKTLSDNSVVYDVEIS